MGEQVTTCQNCGGTGSVQSTDPSSGQTVNLPCPTCNGRGLA